MCKNYYPISLANLDNNILAKILAARLLKVVVKLMHTDQTGFLKKQYSSDNTGKGGRKLFNTKQYSKKLTKSAALCTADAEKAFDRIKWSFMFSTLQKHGFGLNFIRWIKMTSAPNPNSFTKQNKTKRGLWIHINERKNCPGMIYGKMQGNVFVVQKTKTFQKYLIGYTTHCQISLKWA